MRCTEAKKGKERGRKNKRFARGEEERSKRGRKRKTPEQKEL